MSSTQKSRIQGAASFSKSIGVLQAIADAPEPPRLRDLLSRIDMTRPTLHRILKALVFERLVETNPDGTYIPGVRLVELGANALQRNNVARIAGSALQELCDTVEESVYLAVRSETDVVYIARRESNHAVRLMLTLGSRVPLYASAIGKAFLANMPAAEQKELLDNTELQSFTPNTVVSRSTLQEQLVTIVEDGYAVTQEEYSTDIRCFGTLVYGQHGPIAGIGVSVPLYRLKSDDTYVGPLLNAAAQVSKQLRSM